jgi:hypothetical protein
VVRFPYIPVHRAHIDAFVKHCIDLEEKPSYRIKLGNFRDESHSAGCVRLVVPP